MRINDVTRQNLDKYIHSYKNTDWKLLRNTLDKEISQNLASGSEEIYHNPTNFEWDKHFITSRIFITALSGINEFHYLTQWDK
jgi:hypothetical protein